MQDFYTHTHTHPTQRWKAVAELNFPRSGAFSSCRNLRRSRRKHGCQPAGPGPFILSPASRRCARTASRAKRAGHSQLLPAQPSVPGRMLAARQGAPGSTAEHKYRGCEAGVAFEGGGELFCSISWRWWLRLWCCISCPEPKLRKHGSSFGLTPSIAGGAVLWGSFGAKMA